MMSEEKQLTIAFDVDDTLIIPCCATGFDTDVPNYETIAIYRWFQAQGNYMIIWSGGGKDYAQQWAEKLGLTADEYHDKSPEEEDGVYKRRHVDIAFDDRNTTLGVVNVKVKRLKNNIVRYPRKVRTLPTPPTNNE
jgi:hypothetical protein